MSEYKCPACKRIISSDEKLVMIRCKCGELVYSKINIEDDDGNRN